MNEKGLGYRQKMLLKFARQHREGWHGYHYTESRVVKSLVDRGLIKINQYNQFKAL